MKRTTAAKNHTATDCPCGSLISYRKCCEIAHSGTPASTAEALMRSRYTAFTLELNEYLNLTWHPSTRPNHIQLNSKQRWLGLKIKTCVAGKALDEKGTVEFVARYKIDGRASRLHEVSQFIKQDGRWYYLSGEYN